MSSDETEVHAPVARPVADADRRPGDRPSWWHRDHPTFSALSGFFAGMLAVLVVPAAFAGVLSLLFDDQDRIARLFPLVLVMLVVPLVLVLTPRLRRFGTYMWVGIVTTAIVVGGVGGLVLYVLVNGQS